MSEKSERAYKFRPLLQDARPKPKPKLKPKTELEHELYLDYCEKHNRKRSKERYAEKKVHEQLELTMVIEEEYD